jgi:polyhydroxyalkanoate synthesis regulator phasin
MMASFQEQNEKMWTTLVEQGLVSQQEGKKMLQEWMNRADQARDQLHKMIDDNWKRVESVFGSTPKTGK